LIGISPLLRAKLKCNFVSVPSSNKDAINSISVFSVLALVARAWKYVWISAVFDLVKFLIHRSTILDGSKVGGGDRWMGNAT
jgi:hypothetical protein